MITPADFVRLAVDPVRLAVLGRAATGAVDAGSLAVDLDVPHKTVLTGIARLREAGLLTDQNLLDREVLREVAGALADEVIADPSVTEGPWSAEEAQVLSRFFRGSKLESIPANHSKRLIVLERLAMEFEPGLRYDERQVNLTLQMFYADFAALRRYLVDNGFLTRADGVYWRSGGRI